MNKKFFALLLSPTRLYQEIKRMKIVARFKSKKLDIGTGVSMIRCDFGDHVYLGNGVSAETVTFGSHTYVNSNTRIRFAKFGKFCSIGSNVRIGLGLHPSNLISSHPSFYSTNKNFKTFADKNYFREYETVEIGNDVWIGENAIVMGGLEIGDGAIVAAGAIVTKNVKAYEVVGGIPAKTIKFRFSEEEIQKIRSTRWWDKEESWYEENHPLFRNTDKFFDYFEGKGNVK